MKTGIARGEGSLVPRRQVRVRTTLAAALITSLLVAPLLWASVAAAQQETEASEQLTAHLVINGPVDPQTIFVFRYAVRGTQQPREQIQLCGGFAFPGATSTLSAEPCEEGRRYTAVADLEPGTEYAIQVASMHPSDPEGSFKAHAQSFEGEGAPQPDEFITFQPGSTHWIWVSTGDGL